MSFIKILFGALSCYLFTLTVHAQKVLTLDDCISIAMENNIDLKRVQNNALVARSNQFQAMMNFLPSLGAGVNYSFRNGTFFDQNAARQVSATTNSSNPSINASVNLFNGFANHYSAKARKFETQALEHGIEEQKIEVRASVLEFYLNVVLDKENIKISNDRIKLLSAQLEREKKRESVGVGNLELVYNFKSQLANENLNLVKLTNRLKSDQLSLLQSLGMEVSGEYEIAPYAFQKDELLLSEETFGEVIRESVEYSPSIKRARAGLQASTYGLKIAHAGYMPVISASGNLGSNYSSNGALNPESGSFERDAGFFDQLSFNKFKSLNFSLYIPIFSNWQNRNQTQVAKINLLNSELDLKQSELAITNTLQKVYLDLVAAQSTYQAAQENLIALNQSYEFVSTRYENGNTDFFTYLESLNSKNTAEIELVNAKYSIIFRKKILDVYKGMF
ncbi:TolC family protein [Reichenbachiella sp. MALMAid0571]|uniref:TolC family protein n=1 Tax=Reichenbachiella sp. MALMAid0571 TaxID=3143939 RepID=UPI0032DE7448